MAAVLAEEDLGTVETVQHLAACGFADILLVAARAPPETLPAKVLIAGDLPDLAGLTNAMIAAFPGRWLHVCHGGEFLFTPFAETRSVHDAIGFATDERRVSVFAVTVDLYKDAMDFGDGPLKEGAAYFDRGGYFMVWPDQAKGHGPQVHVHGGLRWRHAAHIPETRQRLNRPGLFLAQQGLEVGPDLMFGNPEYNSVSCTWHNSLTATVASFRAARALFLNPASRSQIRSLKWGLSERFDWTSDQLMRGGFMEPGQWF